MKINDVPIISGIPIGHVGKEVAGRGSKEPLFYLSMIFILLFLAGCTQQVPEASTCDGRPVNVMFGWDTFSSVDSAPIDCSKYEILASQTNPSLDAIYDSKFCGSGQFTPEREYEFKIRDIKTGEVVSQIADTIPCTSVAFVRMPSPGKQMQLTQEIITPIALTVSIIILGILLRKVRK